MDRSAWRLPDGGPLAAIAAVLAGVGAALTPEPRLRPAAVALVVLVVAAVPCSDPSTPVPLALRMLNRMTLMLAVLAVVGATLGAGMDCPSACPELWRGLAVMCGGFAGAAAANLFALRRAARRSYALVAASAVLPLAAASYLAWRALAF